MVEKAGHKTGMHKMRIEWINEGKPKSSAEDDEEPEPELNRTEAIFGKQTTDTRQKTPTPRDDDPFGDDDDIYNATPKPKATQKTANEIPEEDDLDALMAETEASEQQGQGKAPSSFTSIFGGFGGGESHQSSSRANEPDEDDLDALMAEAEALPTQSKPEPPRTSAAVVNQGQGAAMDAEDDEDALEALMAETESQGSVSKRGKASVSQTESSGPTKGKAPAPTTVPADDEDDLDALMAEAEADMGSKAMPHKPSGPDGNKDEAEEFGAEEEALMAEMDGPW
jgi:replication fork protection complex subunit Csm3/Swi3